MRDMKTFRFIKQTLLSLLLLLAGTTLHASDWVLNEDKYNATHYTDHLYLEVFLADLDYGNTYCKEGTLTATNGSVSIDLLTLKYVNQGDDESQTAEVKGKLLMPNAKAWVTNSQSGNQELTTSEQSFWLTKWGSDHHYMTAKIDFYYSAAMAGGDWKIYFHFKHSNDSWYTRVLRYSIGTSTSLGLPDFNAAAYTVERTGIDRLTFTVPQLPNDIPSKVSTIRMRKCTYDVRYIFYKQDGSSVTVDNTYEASATQQKTEEYTFPDGVGNPARIYCRVVATHGVKDPSEWFNRRTKTDTKDNAFKVVPVPGSVTTDFRQFSGQAALTWTTPSGSQFMEVTPYIYRVETDDLGTPKSGQSWSKRGALSSTNGGALSFTDDDVAIGTYYRYMALNVPTQWINNGISESTLNSPSADLLDKLGSNTSEVMSSAPIVSIYNLRQDTTVKNKVRLTWQYTRVPTSETTVNFKVLRRTDENAGWSEMSSTASGDADPAAGYTVDFVDETLPNSIVRYQYKVRLELSGYRFESDIITAGLLKGTTLTGFDATKGTHDASVTLSWSAQQAGTANSTYIISRRYVNSTGEFMPIHTESNTNEQYTFEDNTVKPGYYYEYRIEAYDGGVLQNTRYAVGFCQSRGTVSGNVHYGSGTAVPDVRLWLRPSDTGDDNTVRTTSQYVHGASEGIFWQADTAEQNIVFGADKNYTVQFFVRPDEGLADSTVLADIPGVGQLYIMPQTDGSYKLYSKRPVVTETAQNYHSVNIIRAITNYPETPSATTTYKEDYGLTIYSWNDYVTIRDKWESEGFSKKDYATNWWGTDVNTHVFRKFKTLDTPITITTKEKTFDYYDMGVTLSPGTYSLLTFSIENGTITTMVNDGTPVANTFLRHDDNTVTTTETNGDYVVYNSKLVSFEGNLCAQMPGTGWMWQGLARTTQYDDPVTVCANCDDHSTTFSIGGAAGVTTGQAFRGNFAEVRVWDHALTDAEKQSVFDRRLNGREAGLALYWPLDEGLERYAFDASYASDLPNGRHATVGNNITSSTIIPSEQQLSRYGVTNEKGEYLIRGIPFMGSGSSYTIVPAKGIHEFNPNVRSLFISPTSLTANNIDFEDVSSFPMTGHIYYAGTNIPAEGIQLYVDGTLLTANGKAQQTNEDGFYSINVPIGEHYVEAKLEDSHYMVDGGRFPLEGTYNFADRVQHDFFDSTLVNFSGRVAGAKYNDTIPVGFGESKNNIGVATITLRLNNESFSFNCQNDYITPATSDRTFESDTVSIRSHAWTGSGDAANTKYIYITTDSATGEFSAKLPPLKYVMKSVVIASNDHIEFTSLPEIDLSNPKQLYTDSIRQVTEQGDTVKGTYQYNVKQVLTYYASPQVDVVERKHPTGAFGVDSLIVPIDETHNDTIRGVWTKDSLGVHYMFGYPVYRMLDRTEYEIHGYETYINKDYATPVTDTVNLNGQELTIGNEMSADQMVIYEAPEDSVRYTPGAIYQMKHHKLILDKNGRALLPWTVGAPNIVAPFTRQFTITLKRDNRTYEPFRMDAIVLGQLTTGNNFVTKGPDAVQFILRDPYGAQSKTTLKRGKVETHTHYDTYIRYGNHSLVATVLGGVDVTVGNGIGVMMLTGNTVKRETDVGVEASWQYTHRYDSIYETTTIESISTSDKSPYVGACGDVYVGMAKNLLVGTSRHVQVKKNVETGKYGIVLEDDLAFGQQINTEFAYTQYELENVMIPKWKDQRAQYLTQVGSEHAARSYVNNSEHVKCVTWLRPSDPHYGDSATYVFVQPADTLFPKETEIDSVEWCNNQIGAWEYYIRKNEEAKVRAIEEQTPKNYSIDGGTSRTFVIRHDTTAIDQYQTTYKVGAVLGEKFGFQYSGFISFGAIVNVKSAVGGGSVSGAGDDEKNYTEWEYVLSDGNRDVDLSVNMYPSESGSNSKIFSLFGGQTYNPYEPVDSTHYYTNDAGEHVALGNGSVQMEQPNIRIGTGDSAPGEHLTITDIPAGHAATAVLYCTNMAHAHQVLNFSYDLGIPERSNPHGLEILMDGTPINGRSVYLNQSETTQKVITLRQTDESILDYDSIEIWFKSQYQPTIIYDVAMLSAHFTPSSSPVTLTVSNPIVNTDPTTGEGKLQLRLSGFNRQFRNLKNIGVQYRFAGNTEWTNLFTWEKSAADTTGSSRTLLPETGDLRLTVDMSNDLSYPEGNYEFRAFTTTPYDKEMVQVFSEVTQVIKDMTKPRPLFTPAPSNGILGIGDQLSIEFNEDIVPGYVGDKNIIVSAKLNGRPIDHDVSLRILPFSEEAKTMNPVFLNGNFSMECWLNIHRNGIILRQGSGENSFALSTDSAGHAVVRIAGVRFLSEATLPYDQWVFLAMNYKADNMTFNLLAQYGDTTVWLFQNQKMSAMEVQVVDYAEDNYLYLGPIDANIHDLALYNMYRDVVEACGKKYEMKDAYTYGMTNYWPMKEGHGQIASDTRHTHDFQVPDMWSIEGVNYSLRLDSVTGCQADISTVNTGRNDSYAIELWYWPSMISNGDTVFATDNMCLHYDSLYNLVLDYGVKSQTVVSSEDFPNVWSNWHHLALNVVRGQAASFYLDGKRTAVIAEADVPVLHGAGLAFGKGGELCMVDEIRIWKATLTEERLLSNMYNTIDTADLYSRGLIAYYPFEKDSTINGVRTKGFTLKNMAPRSLSGNAGDVSAPASMSVRSTPALKSAPSEVRITAVPVASERKVVINLAPAEVSARDIEGTTLNITVAEVHDLHGNMSDPIKWTAYVQQNTLVWLRDSVNIAKKYGEEYRFSVDIENKSGQVEYYTIAGMPEWLSLVENGQTVNSQIVNSFDVGPLRTKTLTFSVTQFVPVGNYDVTIGLKGNNEILEPLRIVMKVRGETPNWTVDPTLYDHSMTIIGQVYLGGILMESPESMVAAFIGGECRGVSSPEQMRGAAYVTLNVYGLDIPSKDGGKPISFRIWDASKGVAYTDAQIAVAGKDTTILFKQDALVGNFDVPVIWTKSDKVEQLLSVHENWNWISLGVDPETQYCDVLFADYSGWNILLKDTGNYIQSNGAEWRGSLKPEVNKMYKMKISRTPSTQTAELNSQLSIRGRQLSMDEMPVEIAPGWNWIPYTPLNTKRLDAALSGVSPVRGDIIKSQTAVSIFDIAHGWEGTLKALESGHGYLYYSTDSKSKSFTYPADFYQPVGAPGILGAPQRQNVLFAQETNVQIFTPVDRHAYPNNMTMTIRLVDGESVVDSCEIGAFVAEECRGAVRASEDGLYYLVISGEGAGQAMEIKTVLNGEIVTIDGTQTYVSDDHIGTPWAPYIIDLSVLRNSLEDVSGDTHHGSNVRKIIEDGHVIIIRGNERYDVTGKKLQSEQKRQL